MINQLHTERNRFGILTFNDNVQRVAALNQYPNRTPLISMVNQQPFGGGGSRNTAAAIAAIKSDLAMSSRPNARGVGILVTAGNPANIQTAAEEAQKLLSAGGSLLVYDTSGSDNPDLRMRVATRPDLYFRSSGFNQATVDRVVAAVQDPDGGVCGRCKYSNGEYLYRDMQSCQVFHQCVGIGQPLGVVRNCPYGQFYNPATLTCQLARAVSCPTDPCRTPGVSTHPNTAICSAYWECENGRTARVRCCGPNQHFQAGTGCVTNNTCTAACPPVHQILPSSCTLSTIANNPSRYREEVRPNEFLDRDCAPGAAFDATQCRCSELGSRPPPPACNEVVNLSFDVDDKDTKNWIYVDNRDQRVRTGTRVNPTGTVGGGAAEFDGINKISLPRFANAYFGKAVTVRIRFLERTPLPSPISTSEMIYGNGDCGPEATLKMMYYRAENKVEGKVTVIGSSGRETEHTATVTNVQSGLWKDTELRYNGSVLSVSVNGVVGTTRASGNIAQRLSSFQLASGCNNEGNFYGYEDEFYLYQCLP